MAQPALSGASVLVFHSIGDNPAAFTVSSATFERYIAHVAHHYKVITPSQLVQRLAHGDSLAGYVCITFDDGYADNLSLALPVLEKYNVRAGVFVITSRIGSSYTHSSGVQIPLMTADQVREAHARGMEILSHTNTHRDVRDISADEYEQEFEGSRRVLEEIVGAEVPRIVAYPKGRSHEVVRTWLAEHGWHAFGTRGGITMHTSPVCDIERNGIRTETTWQEFLLKLSDGIKPFEKMRGLRF